MTDDNSKLPIASRVVEIGDRQFIIDDWQDGKPPKGLVATPEFPVIGHIDPAGRRSISVHGAHLGQAHGIRQEWRSHAAVFNSTGEPDDILEAYKIFCLADYQFERNVTLGFMEHGQAEVALDLYLDLDDIRRGIQPKAVKPRTRDDCGRGRSKDPDRLPAARHLAHGSIAAAVVWQRQLFHRSDADYKAASAAFYDNAQPHLPAFKWQSLFSPKAETARLEKTLRPYLIERFAELAAGYETDARVAPADPLSGRGVAMNAFRGSMAELARTLDKGPFVRERHYRDVVLPSVAKRLIRGAAY